MDHETLSKTLETMVTLEDPPTPSIVDDLRDLNQQLRQYNEQLRRQNQVDFSEGKPDKPSDVVEGIRSPPANEKADEKAAAAEAVEDKAVDKKAVDGPNNTDEKKSFKSSDTHRKNSREWHQKWVKKGVPRSSTSETKETSSEKKSGSPSEPTGSTMEKESSDAKPISNLARAKDKFIAEWLNSTHMPKSNERRAAAIKAWMESSERANLLAGRSGVQN